MNLKYYAICECCNFKALTRTKFEVHLKSEKHKRRGRSKIEYYICESCGYWCMHKYNLNIHKVVCHGTIEEKKQALFYCEYCNKAFYCNLFYQNHIGSGIHKKMVIRYQLIENNKFKDIDNMLIEPNYLLYIDELETKIKSSLYKLNTKLSNCNKNYILG
jgi:hypothetical protein